MPSRSVLTYTEYTNVSVKNTTIYLIYIRIVYSQGDMFRPSLGHPQAQKSFYKILYSSIHYFNIFNVTAVAQICTNTCVLQFIQYLYNIL